MKEAIVSKGPKVHITDSPIPPINDDQVLIRVKTSGSNPKDWKVAEWRNTSTNAGDDIAGIVHDVGKNVVEFKKGDRVAAFHEMGTSGGSYAEYAVAWSYATFHIPNNVSFDEAAAIPLAAMTAAVGLYLQLGLPQPWVAKPDVSTPLVIYGAGSSVGAYAVQLAKKSGIHPLICVAGESIAHVGDLIDRSKGDTIVDYRQGDDAVVHGIQKAANGAELLYAFDAVSTQETFVNLGKALSKGAKLVVVLPAGPSIEIPEHIQQLRTSVGCVHQDRKDFGFVYFRYIARGLQEGWFRGQPQVVVPGGLGGIQQALEDLKAGKARGIKYVFRIADTEGTE